MMMERNPGWFRRFGRVIEHYDEALYDRPVFRSMSLTPENLLLVEGRWDSEAGRKTFWLLDENGREMAKTSAPCYGLRLTPRFVLYKTDGEEGDIVVHCVLRTGGDAGELARLDPVADVE
jgi:hypothetical protein